MFFGFSLRFSKSLLVNEDFCLIVLHIDMLGWEDCMFRSLEFQLSLLEGKSMVLENLVGEKTFYYLN